MLPRWFSISRSPFLRLARTSRPDLPLSCIPSCQIIASFSSSVAVTGSPVIKLETGTFDRTATWVNMANVTSTSAVAALQLDPVAAEVHEDHSLLLFQYTVVTGDSATDLDYWGDENVR